MALTLKLDAIEDLPRTPASDVKKLGWRGVMKVIGRDGKVKKVYWKSRNVTRLNDTEIPTTTVENVRDKFRAKYGIEEEFPVLMTEYGNIAVSTAEDVVTAGLLALAYAYPLLAGAIAVAVLATAVWLLVLARRVLKRLFGRRPASEAAPPS